MSTLFFPSLIEIDNYPLTDQGRSPVQRQMDERSVVNQTAQGKNRKYIKAIKYRFTVSWSWLPDNSADTIDGGIAHEEMLSLLTDGTSHTLRFYDGNGSYVEHTVFVSSFTDDLIRRDAVDGRFFWNVSISFEEV